MAMRFGAEIHVLHIGEEFNLSTDESHQAKYIERSLKKVSHSYHLMVKKDVEQGINEYVDEHNIDMVAVLPRAHKLVERLFKGSWTKKLALHCYVPLLVLRDEGSK
jgi:nucleotide-binding universal stress UspA family protein